MDFKVVTFLIMFLLSFTSFVSKAHEGVGFGAGVSLGNAPSWAQDFKGPSEGAAGTFFGNPGPEMPHPSTLPQPSSHGVGFGASVDFGVSVGNNAPSWAKDFPRGSESAGLPQPSGPELPHPSTLPQPSSHDCKKTQGQKHSPGGVSRKQTHHHHHHNHHHHNHHHHHHSRANEDSNC